MNNTTAIVYEEPGINWWGLVAVIIFYILILAIGIFASWRKKSFSQTQSEEIMLAGRDIGMFVGIFTMTATWVGGGYINGTAEYVFTPYYGLLWTQAPVGYAASLLLGGIFFARKMRRAGYVTMLDPFNERYGRVMTAFLYIPALLGEVFWSGAILSALGASLSVILGLDHTIAVIISACIAVFYTVIGGLYSVAFTDVIQLICIFIGLWLGVGFAFKNDAVTDIRDTATGDPETGWIGKVYYDSVGPDQEYYIGNYIDSFLLLIFGGIPWQVYFQRVLAAKSEATAQILSFVAAFGCIFMAVPAVLIGAIAKSTDWNQTEYARYGPVPIESEDYKLILPMVLHYLCPTAVGVIGLGAISAAVMSSADSSVLSASTMFARNIYKPVREAICGKAAEKEIIWVMRVSILFVAAAATVMAIVVDTIYGLWFLCSDLVYVILFPQLILVVYTTFTNTYGVLTGFVLGLFFRLSGGEVLLSLDPLIEYPWYEESTGYQLFPFKTVSMLISLISTIVASYIATFLFKKRILPYSLDIFDCFRETYDISKFQMNDYNSSNGKTNPSFSTSDDFLDKY